MDTDTTTEDVATASCGHTQEEHTEAERDFAAYGPFSLLDLISAAKEQQQPKAPFRMGSLPEVQYCILSALRPYLSDSDVESGYFGTRYTLSLRNGQTAQITITVKDKE